MCIKLFYVLAYDGAKEKFSDDSDLFFRGYSEIEDVGEIERESFNRD